MRRKEGREEVEDGGAARGVVCGRQGPERDMFVILFWEDGINLLMIRRRNAKVGTRRDLTGSHSGRCIFGSPATRTMAILPSLPPQGNAPRWARRETLRDGH